MNHKLKNQALEDFLAELEQNLKPLNSPGDLVKAGIFRSEKTAANCRWNRSGPDYLKLKGCGISYPKDAVLSWFKEKAVYIERKR